METPPTTKLKKSPPPSVVPRCQLCRSRGDDLRCHRHPPTVRFPQSEQIVFPRVLDTDWCGEFAPKK
jgi:hypothetical protein